MEIFGSLLFFLWIAVMCKTAYEMCWRQPVNAWIDRNGEATEEQLKSVGKRVEYHFRTVQKERRKNRYWIFPWKYRHQ